jgi:hypothetical protein
MDDPSHNTPSRSPSSRSAMEPTRVVIVGPSNRSVDRIYARASGFLGRLETISSLVSQEKESSEVENHHAKDGPRTPRITLRLLMILVAIVAIVLGTERVWRQRAFCLKTAAFHGQYEVLYSGGIPDDISTDDASVFMLVMRPRKESADYHARMRQKWERAALRPWVQADPDPPRP